ncbi:MAG: PAS domain-containing protein, partial [bacterium]|nr:PAS domain-containing protein [bacterium]
MTKITPPNNDYPCNNNNIDQLRAENIKFRQLVDSLPVEIYWKDKNGVWEGANIRCLTHLKEMGIINKGRISEVLDKTDYQLFNQQTADYRKNDIEVMNEKKEISFEENILLDSGEQITLLSIKTPLYDINGEVSGVLGNTINITHIKKIEMELKQAK